MSERSRQNNKEPIDVCFGIMDCNEKGELSIPPEYAYKIAFRGDDCMVIPLEGKEKKRKETSKEVKKQDKDDMQH